MFVCVVDLNLHFIFHPPTLRLPSLLLFNHLSFAATCTAVPLTVQLPSSPHLRQQLFVASLHCCAFIPSSCLCSYFHMNIVEQIIKVGTCSFTCPFSTTLFFHSPFCFDNIVLLTPLIYLSDVRLLPAKLNLKSSHLH